MKNVTCKRLLPTYETLLTLTPTNLNSHFIPNLVDETLSFVGLILLEIYSVTIYMVYNNIAEILGVSKKTSMNKNCFVKFQKALETDISKNIEFYFYFFR